MPLAPDNPVTTPARRLTPAPPPTPPSPPPIWKEFCWLKLLAELEDEEEEDDAEELEDFPKPAAPLFDPNPNTELSELDDELLAADDDEELLPDELEDPAKTALSGTLLRKGVFWFVRNSLIFCWPGSKPGGFAPLLRESIKNISYP